MHMKKYMSNFVTNKCNVLSVSPSLLKALQKEKSYCIITEVAKQSDIIAHFTPDKAKIKVPKEKRMLISTVKKKRKLP